MEAVVRFAAAQAASDPAAAAAALDEVRRCRLKPCNPC